MDALDIKHTLERKGITLTAIAKEYGCRQIQISKVIRRQMVSDGLMKLISKKLGMDHRIVFSDYYLKKNKKP